MGNKSLLEEAQRFRKSIGTKNESSLHRALKFQYTGTGGKSEVQVGEYVADGITKKGEYIEVQTGSFAPLRKKVKEFVSHGNVRIIYPVSITKKIEVFDTKGKLLYRRKSPVRGSLWDLFDALLYAPELALVKGITIEVALVDTTEKRIKDGKGTWRKKGISKKDKSLAAFHESVIFTKKADFIKHFVPFKTTEEFTVTSHAEKTEIKRHISQKALYVLAKMKVVKRIGKKGKSWIYTR